MKRNPLLGSILSACACLIIAVSCAQQARAQAATEGSLFAIANGKPSGPCPLKHTDVKAEVSGFIARVTVTQLFENPFPDKIEAVYKFPLPQAAAVDDMTIFLGDRVVRGKIMTRDEAQKTYEAARARGQVAALLNQERPNIFTQSVANILPSEQIKVVISYVETLKYDEGSYEWSFPMVVGPRYEPATEPANQSTPGTEQADATDTTSSERVPDADRITPPETPEGLRAGHDISLEVVLDAGVPIVGFRSETHEIESLQPSASRAVVHLKDRVTIPNKDFVLKYDVAGSRIEDALLMHRQGNDGYFTFILQPPQRVTVADVTPKEMVFVIDTSGSMGGFPIEKAKETMMLALDGLYPRDTFNLILFSGDTKILFSDPQPATQENINKAKKLLASAKGDGGTEMMKAIRAALKSSDAQDHVRVTCFMTDGMVGDDMEIIAEVQKHPNARVFAMGFGNAPNRFLLDKIAEYGRGEVEYVAENGDAKSAAQRFYERVRNPLLTDVSIDWSGLPVKDIYPKKIPDLFSAKPVVVSGQYATSGKGIIHLYGKMSGREFMREIPVEFPEQESQHDVLATLWARRKVDDLMGQDMDGAQTGNMKDQVKKEITSLGLAYRMMTQFTSFVAVDDQSVIDGIQPRRVDVSVESPAGSANMAYGNSFPSGINETVTVSAEAPMLNSADASVSITTRQLQNLPINGRSLQSFVLLAPSTVAPAPADSISDARFNFSSNGQRPASNQIVIDGVSGNFGVTPGGESPGASAMGSAPALTAAGATTPIVLFGTINEVVIRPQSTLAEYGRTSGAVVSIVTKAGTNVFHGSAFESFSDDALNANDWFANSRSLAKRAYGSNEFGGTIGGPIQRNKFFFFASYEGLRLRQPITSLSDVPSLTARRIAAPNVLPLLNLYPLPTGPSRGDGFAEFAASFANRAGHDSGSLRLDRNVSDRLTLRANYNFTDSSADERGPNRASLNTLGRLVSRSQSITGAAQFTPSRTVAGEIKLNFSHFSAGSSYRLDDFGGAALPPASVLSQAALFANNVSFRADLNGLNTILLSSSGATSIQRQMNVVGSINFVAGNHTFKFGADYRRMFPVIGMREHEMSSLFDGVSQASTGEAARIDYFTRIQPQRPTFNNFSLYGQDEWRKTPRLTFTYGLRWELNPAPRTTDRNQMVVRSSDPSLLMPVAESARLWQTTFANFAPRIGAAYQLNKAGTFVVRGAFGVFYDAVNSPVGDAFSDSYPFLNGSVQWNSPFGFSIASAGVNPTMPVVVPVSVFDPHLKLPYSLQWTVSVEHQIGSNQAVSAAYVASANRRLLLTSTLLNPTADYSFVRSTNNDGQSDYRALQIQLNRRFSNHFGAMMSYTWGKSTDDFSEDSAARVLFRASDSRQERGPSDFDIRHKLAGSFSYDLHDPFKDGIGYRLFHNWRIDSVIDVRSATPINVIYAVPTSIGFLYLRPDVVAGVPLYATDGLAAGGRRINPDAFTIPASLRQGTFKRNALRGLPLSEVDVGLRRRFNFSEDVRLTIAVDALNVFNHPNFAAPAWSDASLGTRFEAGSGLSVNPTFGQSWTNAARGPWGFAGSSLGSSYYPGASRILKFSMKLEF